MIKNILLFCALVHSALILSSVLLLSPSHSQCTSLDTVWLRLQTQLRLGLCHWRVSAGRCSVCDWLTRAQLLGAREEPVGTKRWGKLVENGAVSRNKEKSLLLL